MENIHSSAIALTAFVNRLLVLAGFSNATHISAWLPTGSRISNKRTMHCSKQLAYDASRSKTRSQKPNRAGCFKSEKLPTFSLIFTSYIH
jgi:hypothetical protein